MSTQTKILTFEDVQKYQSDLNEKLLKKFNKSLIFADNQFLEWFNLTVGIDYLIKNAGALNIKSFSSFEVKYYKIRFSLYFFIIEYFFDRMETNTLKQYF